MNAHASVLHGEDDVALPRYGAPPRRELRAGGEVCRTNSEAATLRHCVAGVDAEVHHHLFQLRAVTADVPNVRLELDGKAHVFSDDSAQQAFHIQHHLVDAQGAAGQGLLPGEGQQLADERRRPLALALDFGEVPFGCVVPGKFQTSHGCCALDAGEHIVEVMRHAPGEHAHGVHLLRPLHLGLEAPAVGDVSHRHHQARLGVRHCGHRYLELKQGAVRAARLTFEGGLTDGRGEPRGQEVLRRPAEHFVGLHPKNLLRSRVHRHQSTRRRNGEQPVRHVRHHRPKFRLAASERGVRPTPSRPLRRFAAFAQHRGPEAGQVVLHQVVVRSGLHRRNGVVLADGTADNEKGDVSPRVLKDAQRLHRREARHSVVRDNDVPGRAGQRG